MSSPSDRILIGDVRAPSVGTVPITFWQKSNAKSNANPVIPEFNFISQYQQCGRISRSQSHLDLDSKFLNSNLNQFPDDVDARLARARYLNN